MDVKVVWVLMHVKHISEDMNRQYLMTEHNGYDKEEATVHSPNCDIARSP